MAVLLVLPEEMKKPMVGIVSSFNEIVPGHILIVPRADGRGVNVSEAAWFLVKGGYSIK